MENQFFYRGTSSSYSHAGNLDGSEDETGMGTEASWSLPGGRRAGRGTNCFGLNSFRGSWEPQLACTALFSAAISVVVRFAFWIDGNQHLDDRSCLSVDFGCSPRTRAFYWIRCTQQCDVAATILVFRRDAFHGSCSSCRRT